MKKKYSDSITYALIGVMYIFAVIKATLCTMHVPVTGWQMLMFALASYLFYVFVNTYAGRIIFLSAVALCFLYSVYFLITDGVAGLNRFFDLVTKLVNVIIQVGTGYYNETISDAWLMSALGVFSLIVAMPVYYFLVRYFKFYYLIVPGLVFFMVEWGIMRYVDRLSFFIFITIAIILFIRHRYLEQGRKIPGRSGNFTGVSFTVYFIPVALVIILIASVVPVRNMPVQWEWMDKKIIDLWRDANSVIYTERYDEFALSKTGFGNSRRLGGPVNPDETLIIVVKAPARVYLRGAVYDVYTGSGWELSGRDKHEYLNDRVADQRELQHGWKVLMMQGMARIFNNGGYTIYSSRFNTITAETYKEIFSSNAMPEFLRRLFPTRKIEIQYRQISTKTLFTPLKLMLPITGLKSGYEIEENIGGIFFSNRRLKESDKYNLDYLQPVYGTRELENFLQSSWNGAYRVFNENIDFFIENIKYKDIKFYNEIEHQMSELIETSKLLQKRRDEIHEMYLQVPDSITDRVKALAWNLTWNRKTDYEKVKAIENFLSRNFNYTLSPNVPPTDWDFVDYFLFEGKEGYCSYYASAMCILTRITGIPARYVEGFVLPAETGEDGYYYVRNKHAHAWVEVYLEGIGWVQFEPTAPMSGAMNYYVSYSGNTREENQNISDIPDIHEMEEEFPRNENSVDFGKVNNDKDNIYRVNIIFIVFAAVLLLYLANIVFVGARRVIIGMLPERRCVIFLYRYAVFLLGQSGCKFKTGETPLDYAARVDELFWFKDFNMKDMVEVYYSVRFGRNVPDKNTLKKLFEFTKELKFKTGRDMNIIKRIAIRCFLFNG